MPLVSSSAAPGAQPAAGGAPAAPAAPSGAAPLAHGIRVDADASDAFLASQRRFEEVREGVREALGRMGCRLLPPTGPGVLPRELAWDDIGQAATALGAADPGQTPPAEWLLVTPRDDPYRPLVRRLRSTPDRDALVAQLQSQLGTRFAGERQALRAMGPRFGVADTRRGPLVTRRVWLAHSPWPVRLAVGLLTSPLVLLFALAVVVMLAAAFAVAFLPLVSARLRAGLTGIRDAVAVKNTPAAPIVAAAIGTVRIEGRVLCDAPSPAGVSGRPSVRWEVIVEQQGDDGWDTVDTLRGGDTGDLVRVQDATGTLPVWLNEADIVLQEQVWRAGRDELPPAGVALLRGRLLTWARDSHLRVTEKRLCADAPVCVLGTLDEARRLPPDVPPAVAALSPSDLVVWEGDPPRPFVLTYQGGPLAAPALSRRAWKNVAIGSLFLLVALVWAYEKIFVVR